MAKILLRRDTAVNWQSVNPVLAEGEIGIETDTMKAKLGDGVTAWNDLAYFKDVTFTGDDATDLANVKAALHTHSNKTVLDAITNAGSGEIITDVERQSISDNTAARHTHSNKSVLDLITNSGDGSKFLADDGTYKPGTGGGASTFDDLADTPSTKIAGKYVKVSNDGTTLEYADGSGPVNLDGMTVVDSVYPGLVGLSSASDGDVVFAKSFWQGYDVGGGYFVYDSSMEDWEHDVGWNLKSDTLIGGWRRIRNTTVLQDPHHWGAIGDGKHHLASEFFSNLTECQKYYPFVDDLNDWEIDECGWNEAARQAEISAWRNGSTLSTSSASFHTTNIDGTYFTRHGFYFYVHEIYMDGQAVFWYTGSDAGTLERPQFALKTEGSPPWTNRAGKSTSPTFMNLRGWFDEEYPEWEANKAYNVGDIVYPTGESDFMYVCEQAGTSGTSEPSWDTTFPSGINNPDYKTAGGTTVDGGVVWRTQKAYKSGGWSAIEWSYIRGIRVRTTREGGYTNKEWPRVSGWAICNMSGDCSIRDVTVSADWDGMVFYKNGMLSIFDNIRVAGVGRDGIVWTHYSKDFTTTFWLKHFEIANFGRYALKLYTGGVWVDCVLEDGDIEAAGSGYCDGLFDDDNGWFWKGVPAAVYIRAGGGLSLRNVRTEDLGSREVAFHFENGTPELKDMHGHSAFLSRLLSSNSTTQEYSDFISQNGFDECTPTINGYVESEENYNHNSLPGGSSIQISGVSKVGDWKFYTGYNSGVPDNIVTSDLSTFAYFYRATQYSSEPTKYITPIDSTNYPMSTFDPIQKLKNTAWNGGYWGAQRLAERDISINGLTYHAVNGFQDIDSFWFNVNNYGTLVHRIGEDYPIFPSRLDFSNVKIFPNLTVKAYPNRNWQPWFVDFKGNRVIISVDGNSEYTSYYDSGTYKPWTENLIRYSKNYEAAFKGEFRYDQSRKDYKFYKGDRFYNTGDPLYKGFTGSVILKTGAFAKDWSENTTVTYSNTLSYRTSVNGNGLIWVTTNSGMTGNVEPSWTGNIGDQITEQPDYPAWAASTAYDVGDKIMPSTSNGFFYECATAGTSGETEPTWPTSNGETIADGTVEWTARAIVTWEATFPESKLGYFGRVYETNKLSGTTADRPAVTEVGFQYFDTDLGKPIYWDGSQWVDATGTAV